SLQETDGEAVLTVTDDGPGIPIEKHELVFERFGRIDAARNRADGGTGLGLAITKETIERHGGTITIDANHTGGARLVVRLPAT
ncbi:MAG: ATP-binding protein, partial [Acidimicrobiia bacterium]|nr:ATP-binding protein [Acidimicrobiia bacterium]